MWNPRRLFIVVSLCLAAISTGAPTTSLAHLADGSHPPEQCNLEDPTDEDGCVTPRMLATYEDVQQAGFTRFARCYRDASSGEHPKGRACDFSIAPLRFLSTCGSAAQRAYGNQLASHLVQNANRLHVLHVVWSGQIWLPSSGWRPYSGGSEPSCNRVHVSVL